MLLTNGGVIRNKVLIKPLDLFTKDDNISVEDIGIDAIEIEGFLNVFNKFTDKIIENIDDFIDTITAAQKVDIIFSFEDINEEFVTGPNSILPPGTLVSADDLIELRFSNGSVSANVIRSGADGVPLPAPDILEKCEEEEMLGLDAACTCLQEDIVFDELRDVWFSTSLDPSSKDFTHGDILRHTLNTGCKVFLANTELTGSKQKGLDGLDFLPERLDKKPIKRFTFNCQKNFIKGPGGIERLILELGSNEMCVLKLTDLTLGETVKISSHIRTGVRPAIKIEPDEIEANANGEAEFSISAIERGTDWAAWATPNEQGKLEFNKHAFDLGYAWGLLVIVK